MSTVTFDVVRATEKYVVDENGDISQVAANTPAFEYNADGTYKGMSVEEERENICLQSEDINTTWTSSNATPTQSTETTPDGDSTNKYIKLVDDNTGGGATDTVYITQPEMTVTAGQTYTASVFLKADQLSFGAVQATNYDGNLDGTQFFGLSGAGTLGTVLNLDDSKIEAYPNGWYRCSITWTQGASDTGVLLRIFVADSISNITVDLDGTSSIFVWGAQLELGANASSYIPTTTTSVTRNKDDISNTSASTYIGTAGTIYAEVQIDNILNENQWIMYVRSTTTPAENYISMYLSSSGNFGYRLEASNVLAGSHDETATTGNHKLAIVYTTGDIRMYLDGVQVDAHTNSFTFGETLSEIYIGKTPTATTAQFNNWIRAFAFYKRALTDTEAIALTS